MSKEKYKKIIVIFSIILTIITLCLIYNTIYKRFPRPDKIIIYVNNNVSTVVPNDYMYYSISFNSFRMSIDPSYMETLIDDDTLSDAKKQLAVEFYYNEEKMLKTKECNISYSKIFFFASGYNKGEACFYKNGEYQSGTIAFKLDKLFLFFTKLFNNQI